jgi:hypothetical protein
MNRIFPLDSVTFFKGYTSTGKRLSEPFEPKPQYDLKNSEKTA